LAQFRDLVVVKRDFFKIHFKFLRVDIKAMTITAQ